MTSAPTPTRWLVAAALFLAFGAGRAAAWPEDQARIGAENHPKILAAHGGQIANRSLSDYLERVGRRIVAVTPHATEPWTFSVLDTPVVNAFATTGGYVYVTRGMLALANSESELAAVIGHEIAHITARHLEKRQERGNRAGIGVLLGTAIGGLLGGKDGLKDGIQLSARLAQGYVAQFSQKQEFDADRIGTTYLSAAGYDPGAQARVLEALAAKQKLEALIAGKAYNPNRVDFFGTHPATAERVRLAADQARDLPGDEVAEERYMSAIHGMIYGDSAEQGFVRDRRFVHPVIGFEFTVPEGFIITNSARSVVAEGPEGSKFILDSGGKADAPMEVYLRRIWLKQIERQYGDAAMRDLQSYSRPGYDAMTALVDFTLRGKPTTVQITLIRLGDQYQRLSGLAPAGDWGTLLALSEAAQSYRVLTPEEAARNKPYRIHVIDPRPRDTAAGLASAMPLGPHNEAVFRTLNGLGDGEVAPGDLVKLVVE